jgi:murein DD-endopeptidase MepM/ murein hydrolase activator NlpD
MATTVTIERRRPDFKYLFASGLFGFVLGAFVVASLGNFTSAGVRANAKGAVATVLTTTPPLAPLTEPVKGPPATAVDDPPNAVVEVPSATSGTTGVIPATAPEAIDLAARKLTIPVVGIPASKLVRSYHDARSGSREHEALDILAPRNTPIVAVEDGTVAKLFNSKAGGITLYQFDPGQQYCYYYAHLERYADGIKEGDHISRGQVLGYVGTTGNAPKDTPHLHFAVYRLTADKHWWEGTPIDPYDILR